MENNQMRHGTVTATVIDLSNAEVLAELEHGIAAAPDRVTFFSDEWRDRRSQCEAFLRSRAGEFDRVVDASDCAVQEVPETEAAAFLDANYVRPGVRRLLASFGLYEGGMLLGVIAMASPRGVTRNRVTVQRLCFLMGVHVQGGAALLFDCACEWARGLRYDAILATSENRLTSGTLCVRLGFERVHGLSPDYSYVKDGRRYTKESQRKCRVGGPWEQSEQEVALSNGFVRVYDAGRTAWVFHLNLQAIVDEKQRNSERVARLHSDGVFKNAHMRGYFQSIKNGGDVYFGSSYELRCLFELEQNVAVRSFQRCEAFRGSRGWRNPDLRVEFVDGHSEIWEVKPSQMLEKPEVKMQIADSFVYAGGLGLSMRVWTERDSELKDCRAIIRWAHAYLAEQQGDITYVERHRATRKAIRDRQYAKQKAASVTVHCSYCNVDHIVLPRTYARNVARNGIYTCEAMAGHKGGSKPKLALRKENPYAAEGKKACCRCQQVLPFAAFDRRTKSRDGYAHACKACCSLANAARYRARVDKAASRGQPEQEGGPDGVLQ